MGRVVLLLLAMFGAFIPNSSLAWVKIECSRNLKEDCGNENARACFDSLGPRIILRCLPGIDERTSCGDVPPMRPDFEFSMARCQLLHECDHARSFENQFRISACMDEYSAYLISQRCYRDSYHQFCPSRLNTKQCKLLEHQVQFVTIALSYLSCLQKRGPRNGCLRTCQLRFDFEECERIHQAYSGCAK